MADRPSTPESGSAAENEVEIYTLQDEEGVEHEFELIGTCEKNGVTYYAMIPAEESEREDEFCEYVILKAVIEDGEETLVSIDDDDEFDDVADYFDDQFAAEIDYDDPGEAGGEAGGKTGGRPS